MARAIEIKRSRSLLGWLSPARWMRREWDRRARENAQYFIACGHSETDSRFWESGRRDLEVAVLHDVNLSPEARALEIGCGLGRLLRPLSEKIEKVVGVDISVEMVERARRSLADRSNVEVYATTGRLSPIPDASLDFVYSFIVFQHIPTRRAVARYIREASRVLAGGGVFRFQVDGRPRAAYAVADPWVGVSYEPRQLARELEAADFETVGLWGEHTHYLWATARRRARAGRGQTRAVRARRRRWDHSALESLLARLGLDPVTHLGALLSGDQSLRRLADRFLAEHAAESPEAFVRRAYEILLGREPDAEGLAFYAREIASGIPPANTIDCLISSSELEEQLRPELPER